MHELWAIKKVELRFTLMTGFMKRFVAVGLGKHCLTGVDGRIAILPQTSLLMVDQDRWLETARHVLLGHSSAITALFVPDFYQENERRHLLSGDGFGHVVLWNAA
jgi:hypothetical protein